MEFKIKLRVLKKNKRKTLWENLIASKKNAKVIVYPEKFLFLTNTNCCCVIENSKTTKGMSKEELKDRENQLNQHLEVITNIAQRIENENRTLMKKNSELKKEYQNQENDRELLLKQLVMLK